MLSVVTIQETLLDQHPEQVLTDFLATLDTQRQDCEKLIEQFAYGKHHDEQQAIFVAVQDKITQIKDFLQKIQRKEIEAQYQQRQ